MKVDVVIPTMRKPSLPQVQHHLAQIGCLGSIVVADFFPVDKLESRHELPVHTKHIEITGHQHFNKSIAINIGFHFTSSELVAICDADILLDADFFTQAIGLFDERPQERLAVTPKHVRESADGSRRPAPGVCLLHRDTFLELQGFCNAYRGWGLEDRDFLSRLSLIGVVIEELASGIHLSHGNEERIRNYHSTSLGEMRQKNWELFCERKERSIIEGTLTNDILTNKFHELT
jgi:glycosyltransferase involved in cell wall biosynthesis